MCIKAHLKVWVQYRRTGGRLAQMMQGARYLNVSLRINRRKSEFPAFTHLLRAGNWCWEGGFTAQLPAGARPTSLSRSNAEHLLP